MDREVQFIHDCDSAVLKSRQDEGKNADEGPRAMAFEHPWHIDMQALMLKLRSRTCCSLHNVHLLHTDIDALKILVERLDGCRILGKILDDRLITGISSIDQGIAEDFPRCVRQHFRSFVLYNAQLWMSCQSASLLDDLTKEEVVFCEKDHRGRSQMYSLMDVGSVRRSDNLYRKYLGGVYGAVPQIG